MRLAILFCLSLILTPSLVCAFADFESGNLNGWTLSGDGNWSVTDANFHAGAYAAEAPASIGDSQSAAMEVTLETESGQVSFRYSVSSEGSCDYLSFYIDGVQQGAWSGSVPWTQATYPVTGGTHTLKWAYTKDGSISSGSDTAWVDDIFLPVVPVQDHGDSIATATVVAPSSSTAGQIDPAGDNDYFRIDLTGSGTLAVYTTGTSIDTYGYLLDAQGNTLAQDDDGGSELNFYISSSVSAGTYYVRVHEFSDWTGTYTLVSEFTSGASYTVTPSVGSGGGISPATAQVVNNGGIVSFTVTPDAGYVLDSVSGCGGILNGNTFTTGAISGDCAVAASFAIETPIGLSVQVNQADTSYCPTIRSVVTVHDADGNALPNLTGVNFVLREDGVVITPSSFQSAGGNSAVSVALTLDYSGSMSSADIVAMETAAQSFIGQLNAIDAGEVIKFSSTLEVVQGFTTDQISLTSAVSAPWSGSGGMTAFYDAVHQAASDAGSRSGRRAVIAMTDGIDNESLRTLQDVIDYANQQGVPVFTVGLGSVDSAGLQHLANATGGQYYYAPDSAELHVIYQAIAEELSNQYVVEYTTTATDGLSHTLAVEVSANGLSGTASRDFISCGQLNVSLNQVDNESCGTTLGVVSVTDSAGTPVTGLTASNFTVRENGVVQTLTTVDSATAAAAAISLAMTLDYSGSMSSTDISAMETATLDFIGRMGANDSGEIIKFAQPVEVVQAYTGDKAALSAAVTEYWGGDNSATAFYDAVYQGITDTLGRDGRRAVIAMTDGSDNASSRSLQVVIDYATQNNVPVFTIGLGSANTTVMQQLATQTGGQYYYAPTNTELADVYQTVANTLTSQYVVEYSSGTSDVYRTVEVAVTTGSLSGSSSRQVGSCSPEGTLAGTVIDSQTSAPVSGATVTISGSGSQTLTTDQFGNYRLILPAGTYTVQVGANGYIDASGQSATITSGATTTVNFALAQIRLHQAFRMVLTWGSTPEDLDSHLWVPGTDSCGHVWYSDQGSATSYPYAQLDVDDTTSYGPETISIEQVQQGGYQYWVHNYSGSPDLTASGAQVQLYDGSTLLQTFTIPTSPIGNSGWHVFDIDGTTGAITVVNQLADIGNGTCIEAGSSHLLTVATSGSGSVVTDPGTLTWNGSTAMATYSAATTVTLTATPASGSTFAGWSGACSGTGSCTVTMDAAKDVTATFTVQADVIAPVLSVSTLTDISVTNQMMLNIAGMATDDSGQVTVSINGEGVLIERGGHFAVVIMLQEGPNTIEIIARDAAGNQTSDRRVITLDMTAPQLTVSTLTDGSYTNEMTLNVAGEAGDENELTIFTINGEAVSVASDGTFSFALQLLEGENIIVVIATDAAANQTSDSRTIIHDLNAPELSITAPADNSKTNENLLEVQGLVDNPNIETVRVTLNDDAPLLAQVADGTFSIEVLLLPGLNTIEVTAADLAGKISSKKRTVTYIAQAPALAIFVPNQDITTFQNSLLLQGTASQHLVEVTVDVTMDGQTAWPTLVGGAFEHVLTFTEERTYIVTVTAIDEDGNSTGVVRNINYVRTRWGDANDDGVIDVADALLALQIAVGTAPLANENLLYGDVAPLANGKPAPDGRINLGDALLILRKTVGLEDF